MNFAREALEQYPKDVEAAQQHAIAQYRQQVGRQLSHGELEDLKTTVDVLSWGTAELNRRRYFELNYWATS